MVCWCRGFASVLLSWLALLLLVACAWSTPWFTSQQETVLCLSCSWMKFWLCVLPVLSVLVCWWLTKMPADEWARVWLKKVIYDALLLSLVDSLAWSLWWLSLTVCAVEHAHCLVSSVAVCVCTWYSELGLEMISSAELIHIHNFPFLFNLPSGYATWHNFYLLCLCTGIINWSHWTVSSSNPRSSEDDLVEFRLGPYLYFSFHFLVFFNFNNSCNVL
jgi:hypothetical protein